MLKGRGGRPLPCGGRGRRGLRPVGTGCMYDRLPSRFQGSVHGGSYVDQRTLYSPERRYDYSHRGRRAGLIGVRSFTQLPASRAWRATSVRADALDPDHRQDWHLSAVVLGRRRDVQGLQRVCRCWPAGIFLGIPVRRAVDNRSGQRGTRELAVGRGLDRRVRGRNCVGWGGNLRAYASFTSVIVNLASDSRRLKDHLATYGAAWGLEGGTRLPLWWITLSPRVGVYGANVDFESFTDAV